MTQAGCWSIDRIAALNLFQILDLAPDARQLDLAAERFAEHRRDAYGWAARRIHGGMIDRLDAASAPYFERHSDAWGDGFRTAQYEVMRTRPDDLIAPDPGPAPTKGKILRSMIRQSRQA